MIFNLLDHFSGVFHLLSISVNLLFLTCQRELGLVYSFFLWGYLNASHEVRFLVILVLVPYSLNSAPCVRY